MAKRKKDKTDLQTLHIKLKITQQEHHYKKRDELMCSGRVGSLCSTSGTRRVTLVTNQMMSHE